MVTLTDCPICGANIFVPVLKCKDHTVSHETFQIMKCHACNFVFTNPRPDDDSLPRYYQSENYISHSNGARSILDIIYKTTRVYTLKHKLSLIQTQSTIQHGSTILDYGCGTGDFLRTCREAGYITTGVEPSEKARKLATINSHSEVYPSIDDISGIVNVITLWHVLEHIPDLNGVLKSLHQKLDKNGTMFIAVPNHESYDAQKYQTHWAAYDVPRHLWHFSKSNMNALLTKNNFLLTNIIPMKLDAYYVSILSEKYQQSPGLLAFLKGLYIGLQSNMKARNENYSSLIYVIQKK